MMEGDREKLLQMESALHSRVVGQDTAVTAVANAVRRSRAGLSDPKRPNGSFLFLGPTGVGKTELCKALAEFLFDTQDAMVRIDMSEFMEKHSVSRLVGAPPGYVGYEEGGQLTEAVRRRPYSVVLLDEVEKAHPEVFNVLLQVLDDGRMTDGKGRTVDFKNTILIMTSNLGSDLIMRLAEENTDEDSVKRQIEELLYRQFKPEFLNRIDETIIFRALSREDMSSIVTIQLERLARRLEDRKLKLRFSQNAKKYLVSVGYDPLFGARPLKRAIRKYIEDPLAMELLENRFEEDAVILVDADHNGIVFTAANREPEVVEAELVE